MKHNRQARPFINVRMQENRTPTGRRTSAPARRAALYYSYGRDREAELAEQPRGQWLGPDGRAHTPAEVMAWVRAKAMSHRYTFQGLLSTAAGALTAAEFGRALQKGGQSDEWRLIAHDDTRYRHAHVLWFGDKRLDKKAFLSWQTEVRAELVRLEQQHPLTSPSTLKAQAEQRAGAGPANPAAGQEMEPAAGQARTKSQAVELGW
jgi:hypothetical protein